MRHFSNFYQVRSYKPLTIVTLPQAYENSIIQTQVQQQKIIQQEYQQKVVAVQCNQHNCLISSANKSVVGRH
jgi:hypothetical protein